MSTQLDPLTVSADLLYSVKTGGESNAFRTQLARFDRDRLEWALSDRPRKLAFWLNVFNAYVQFLLDEHGDQLGGGRLDRWAFFARDQIPIAGVWLSLNDIRDGMLRRSRARWGWGYLPRPFPSRFERQFRLSECDPRVHFALCSGAEHSPPITIYSPTDVDEELDVATEWHLAETTTYDPDRNVVSVPRLFHWYRGDFGGLDGIRSFLTRYDVIPEPTASIEYDTVDWTIDVDLF